MWDKVRLVCPRSIFSLRGHQGLKQYPWCSGLPLQPVMGYPTLMFFCCLVYTVTQKWLTLLHQHDKGTSIFWRDSCVSLYKLSAQIFCYCKGFQTWRANIQKVKSRFGNDLQRRRVIVNPNMCVNAQTSFCEFLLIRSLRFCWKLFSTTSTISNYDSSRGS